MNQQAQCTQDPQAIQTRFGDFDVRDSQVVTFPEGIPGFEGCRRFVLVVSEELSPLSCLHSLDAPYPSFLTVDPTVLQADYQAELSTVDRAKLAPAEGGTLLWLAILTPEPLQVTANLKAPIVLNPARMVGYQVLLDASTYPVSWPLTLG